MECTLLASSPHAHLRWTSAKFSRSRHPAVPAVSLSGTSPPTLRFATQGSLPARERRLSRLWATADAAESKTLEEDSEAAPEEEEPTESAAEEPPPEPNVLEAFKAAIASGEAAALAAVEAQIQALEKDRDSLVGTLSCLEQDIKSSKDKFLRLNADFDNFRKRSEREKLSIATNVKGDVVEALLPMVDSFERAKTSLKLETEAEQKIDGAYQGIYKQFVEVMKGLGVAAVETVGTQFNPEVHEAIMQEESVEFPDGVVSQEFRKGFIIGGKLLRPAMVKVSTGPGPSAVEDGGANGSDGEISSEE